MRRHMPKLASETTKDSSIHFSLRTRHTSSSYNISPLVQSAAAKDITCDPAVAKVFFLFKMLNKLRRLPSLLLRRALENKKEPVYDLHMRRIPTTHQPGKTFRCMQPPHNLCVRPQKVSLCFAIWRVFPLSTKPQKYIVKAGFRFTLSRRTDCHLRHLRLPRMQ